MLVFPGLRKLISSKIQQLFNTASFDAPLTHSLVLNRGTGSPTFTRATTATVRDNEGVLRTAIAGEARFEGARRVRNLVPTTSEDFSNAAWTKGAVTVGDSVANPLTGAVNALKVKEDNTNADHRIYVGSGTITSGNVYVLLFYAKAAERNFVRVTSASFVNLDVIFNLTTGVVTTTVNGTGSIESVGGGWYRCSVVNTAIATGTTNLQFRLQSDASTTSYAGTTGSGAYCFGAQLEDITGRADQTTPSEYVSVGVPSDWAGDELVTNGTFDTATTGWAAWNSGTLSIDASRLKITNDGTGTHNGGATQVLTLVVGAKYVVHVDVTASTENGGVRIGTAEALGDVLAYASGTRTVEFTASVATAYLQVVNDNISANGVCFFDNISVKPAYYHGSMVDGVKCFPTDLSGNPIPAATMLGYQAQGARTNLCLRSGTIYPITYAAAWAASGSITVTEAARIAPDGTVTATRVQTTGASSLNSAAITVTASTAYVFSFWALNNSGTDAKYRVYNNTGAADIVTQTTYLSSINNATWVRISVAFTTPVGCVSISVYPHSTGASGGDLYVWGAQLETGSFASSYIATTTTAVTGNVDVESVSTSGNIAAAAGSIYLEYTPTHTPSGTIALWGTYVDASNYTAILHDATNLIFRKRIAGSNYDATIANAFVSGTTYKVCATWGTAGTSITLNGTEGTPHANTTAAQIAATMQWGADGNSLQQPFASIRNCRDWLRQLSASERTAVTA